MQNEFVLMPQELRRVSHELARGYIRPASKPVVYNTVPNFRNSDKVRDMNENK